MIKPTLDFEVSLWAKGVNFICGIDEVGRGSWAGPLVAAGVILPRGFVLPELLADSKLLNSAQRLKVGNIVKKQALSFSIAQVAPGLIDKIGLTKATSMAFRNVVKGLTIKPDFCLVDAFYIKHFDKKKQQPIIHGDRLCASIAAASIIAKVYRDNLMKKLHFQHPQYGFSRHKGYGTKFHQQAILKYGFLKIHRHSYNFNFLITSE